MKWFFISIIVGSTLFFSVEALAQCTKDTDCKGDRICKDGACADPKDQGKCTKDTDCKGDRICKDGGCVDPKDQGKCTKDTDCKGDHICRDGICTEPKDAEKKPSEQKPAEQTSSEQKPTDGKPSPAIDSKEERIPDKEPPTKKAPPELSPTRKPETKPTAPPPAPPGPIDPSASFDSSSKSSADSAADSSSAPEIRRGLQLGGGLGVTNCTDSWCMFSDPLVGFNLSGLYRFSSYVAVGLHTAFLFRYRGDLSEETDKLINWTLITAPEIRGILPLDLLGASLPKLDIWGSFMIGYSSDFSHTSGVNEQDTSFSSTKSIHALLFGWGAGVDYFVTKNLSVGGSAFVYKPIHLGECIKNTIGGRSLDISCKKVSSIFRDRVGIHWWVGFTVSYLLAL